jgi:hypothetical protein
MAAFPLLMPIFEEIPTLRLTLLSPWYIELCSLLLLYYISYELIESDWFRGR